MTQKCYPLNDVDYDSEDVQLYHAGRTTGIFNVTGDDLKVSYVSGMNVSVTPGTAYLLTDVIFCERKEWIGIEERSSA